EHFQDKAGFFRNVTRTLRPGGKLLLAAWTGSMDNPRVAAVARAFLSPELWTREQYELAIESAGLNVAYTEDLSASVMHTWEICRDRVAMAKPVLKLMPRAVQAFAAGMDTILEGYQSGDLTYSVMSAATGEEQPLASVILNTSRHFSTHAGHSLRERDRHLWLRPQLIMPVAISSVFLTN